MTLATCVRGCMQAMVFAGASAAHDQDVPRTSRSAIAPTCKRGSLQERAQHAIKMCLEHRDLRSLLRASAALCRSVRSTRSRCASNFAICDRSYVQARLFAGACAARDQDVPRTSRSAIAPTRKRGSLQERAQHAIKMCLELRDLRSLLRASVALCRSVRSTRSRCASNFAICDRSYVQAWLFVGACAARDQDVPRTSRSAIAPTRKRGSL